MKMTELEKGELSEYNVTMSNTLARASQTLTLPEKRILAAVIAKIDSRKGSSMHAHLSEFTKIRLSAMDYAEVYGVDPKNAYDHIKKGSKNLFERHFSIRRMVSNKERITRCRWVSSATYAKEEGFIEVSFTPEVYPHLHALKREYTTYKLKNAASFRSVYSWRLYEIAKSWMKHCEKGKPVCITLENLKHQLDWPESYRWIHVRDRAIDPAIKEIEKFEDVEIKYKINKKGRSVHSLDFIFKEKDQLEMDI
jgi:plasmid replication initiation protein